MYSSKIKFSIGIILLTLWAGIAQGAGQWLTEQNISQDAGDSILSSAGFGTNHSGIVVDSLGNPHVVWYSGSPSRIYYSRKVNNAWLPSVTFTPGTSIARFPSIGIDTNNRLHVVWHDYRNGTGSILKIEVYYNTSTIGGSWNNETRLSYATNSIADNRYNPTLLIDHKNALHCIWYDFHWNGFNPDLAYKTTTSGFSWDTTQNIDSTRITFTQLYESPFPALCTDTLNNIHVVWFDDSTGNLEIYYKKKFAGTGLWSNDTPLTNDSSSSVYPCIVSDSKNNLYVFWSDTRDGNAEIYLKKYSIDSNGWLPDQRLTNVTGNSNRPAATVDKYDNIHLVWEDDRDGTQRIYYKKFNFQSQSWQADTAISTGSGIAQYPSIAADYWSNLHVIWQDSRDGNQEIYYREQYNVTGIKNEIWSSYE